MEPNRSENPFSAPSARVSDYVAEDADGALLPEPQRLDVGRGVAWIGEAWKLYREAPGMWVGIIVVFWVIFAVLSMIPLVNLLVSLATPVFFGGLMLGCHALQRGESLEFSHLFAGFQNHFGKLVVAGLIYGVGVIVVMGLTMFGMLGSSGLSLMGGGNAGGFDPGMILSWVGVSMLLMIPLIMTIWFAPALIVMHDLSAMEALTLSFKGCLRNIVPFILFFIVAFLLAIVAMIPVGLGLLVFGPVMIASQYVGYREIFVG